MRYQIYFRFSRGGIGIPYESAKMEFLTVFPDIHIKKEHLVRHQMWVDTSLPPDKVAAIASNLGYTEAILQLHTEPYRGETICPIESGRWYVGWCREGKWQVHKKEVYVQDAELLLANAPHKRAFEILQNGVKRATLGNRTHRAISPLDARFLFNIARPRSTDTILDAFAGFGGFVSEAKRRGLRMVACDIDKNLSPGLSSLAPKTYSVADARNLPLCDDCIDLIMIEPPFKKAYREAVVDSLSELLRVLKPKGCVVMLIQIDMQAEIRKAYEKMRAKVECVGVIPRGGGMKCSVLKVTLP